MAQAEIDAGERAGLITEEREELSRVRRENMRLQDDVDLLKRALAFFASVSRRSCPAGWLILLLVSPRGGGLSVACRPLGIAERLEVT